MNGKGQKNPPRSLSETCESPQYPLFVIEEGEQSGEGVGDGGRAVVVFEDLKHFKTLVVICRAGISKRKRASPPSFNAVRIWPSQNWLARAFIESVMSAELERAVEKPGRQSQ
jgi:hypothetical protein